MFLQLQRCYLSIKENVTFSLVFPLNSPTSPKIVPTSDSTPCEQIFSGTSRSNYDFGGIQYPNNLLRNVARRSVRTKFVMVLDVDILPSSGLNEAFAQFSEKLETQKGNPIDEKTVWVIPAYELKDGATFPQDKEQLLLMRKEETVRPFYKELCWKCQVRLKFL